MTSPGKKDGAIAGTRVDDGEVSTLPRPQVPKAEARKTALDAADVFSLIGTELDKKYAIESVVAEGGFGVVYRGTHIALQKPIAIKVLKTPGGLVEEAQSEFLARFTQEARMIAQLDHPAVVRVLDFGTSPMPDGASAPWMVMEWLTGTTLEADLEARRGQGGRTPAGCLTLLRPVFEAMAAAHDERIAHRDIKPANIMLVQGRKGEVTLKLLDFGISKLMRPEEDLASGRTATQTLLPAFSPDYAAPEQIASMRTGPWTDVHAMALVLTEMLTDLNAYVGTDTTEMYASVLASQRPTPGRFRLDVGPWEQVLAKALSLKPAERYQHIQEFLAALEANVPESIRWKQVTVPTERPVVEVTTLRGTAVETLSDADLEDDLPAPSPPHKMPARLPWALAAAAVCALVVAVVLRPTGTHPSAGAAASHPVLAAPHAMQPMVLPLATTDAGVAVVPPPLAPATPAQATVVTVADAGTPSTRPAVRVRNPAVSSHRPLPSTRPSVVRPAGPVVRPTLHPRTPGDDIPVE